jgi:hypothetical protein
MGHAAHVLIAFIQPGGAGPEHHGHAVAADAGDGLVDGGLNLRQRGQQQLVIAGTVCGEIVGMGGSSPSTPPSTASGVPATSRFGRAYPAPRRRQVRGDFISELPSALTMPTAEI